MDIVDRGHRGQPFAGWTGQGAERGAVELVVMVGIEAVVATEVRTLEDDRLVVRDGGDLENGSGYRHNTFTAMVAGGRRLR